MAAIPIWRMCRRTALRLTTIPSRRKLAAMRLDP
jgi:hypothetical protein